VRLPLSASGAAAGAPYGGPVDDAARGSRELVDWDLAARTAARLARPGPAVSAAEAVHAVALLHESAAAAGPHVAAVTGLGVARGPGALVIERGAWARANVASFRTLLAPVLDDALARRTEQRRPGRRPSSGPPRGLGVAGRVTGAELGSLLAVLSSRVLGQYDALGEGPEAGRLLLVAPNVVAVQRELSVDLADFSLWVALHEETHRVQFAAAPWLAEHLRERARALSGGLLGEPGAVADRLAAGARALPGLVRSLSGGAGGDGPAPSLVDLVADADQRRALAEVTAVMSLLEGHADVAMDAVGPSVVPSVKLIRRRFAARRRTSRGLVDSALRQLLGLDAKMRQYADGARFVRGVTQRVGTDGLNAVWSGPAALPAPEEVADPAAWVRRVHG